VAAEAALNQRDGMHPTADGIAAIVARIVPTAEVFLADVRARGGS
jgi:acyl-CoA thioesterase-1